MHVHMLENRIVDLEDKIRHMDQRLKELDLIVKEMRSSLKTHIEWHPGKGK